MATKNIVPNADSEGGIGTSSKYWATGFIDAITTTGNLVIGGSIDLEGAIDVNGTTNLNIVDIDGAVNIGAEVTLADANKIIFNDASQFIHASSNAILNLGATDEIDLTATAIDVNGTMDVSGAFTNGSTLVSTGKITADAGIDIDNINIDGTTIALSSGNLTLDVAGEIILDADSTGTIRFNDGGTNFGMVFGDSSNFTLISKVQDKDMIFQGNDGGSTITALTLDMSAAGAATFSGHLISTSTSGITNNSTSHAYITPNSSAASTASWVNHSQGGVSRWLSGVEGNETDYQLYSPTGTKFRISSGGDATFSGKLSVSKSSTDFIAEFQNTNGTNPYGARVKDATSPANNYPLFSVTNSGGTAEYFRVNSGTGVVNSYYGIAFPNQSGGNTRTVSSSTLDAYEEGTWTPTFTGCTFTGTVEAKYTRIGREVYISLQFINQTISNTTGTGGGFTGLPFSTGGAASYHPISLSYTDSLSSPSSGFIRAHNGSINFTVGSSITDSSWINGTGNKSMMLSGTYTI